MTLVDTNILLYATFVDAPEHERARSWLAEQFADEDDTVALCWPVVYAFVRLCSSRRVFGESAVSVGRAWEAAEALLAQRSVRLVGATRAHERIAAGLATTSGLRSDDVPDIELATLAIEHGLVLASHDSGFRRFAGLRSIDPLAA